MSTIMIYNDTAEFYLPDCETIRDYLSRFAGVEDLEADGIQFSVMYAIYNNLALLFGNRLSRREHDALRYNLDHIDGQLRGFKYSRNTKGWITANMPTLEHDEDFCSTEILTSLYSFYNALIYVFCWRGMNLSDPASFSVATTDVI